MKYRALHIAWILISLGCSIEHPSDIHNIAGEDSSMAVLMGQGLNHIEWKPKGHCVRLGPTSTQSGQATGQIAEFRLLEIKSLSSLKESLNISASSSLRASIFTTGASAAVRYASSVNKNTSSKYLLVHTRVGNQLSIATSFEFTESARTLLEKSQHERFVDQCGTEFVYGTRTGGEFFALFEFEFSSLDREREFSAAIKAAGTGWKASAEITDAMSRFNMGARTHLRMFRKGGGGAFPDVANLADFARNFPTLVHASSGDFVTLELITKDYKGVEPVHLRANPHLLLRQERVMNQLAADRDAAVELLNTIRLAKSHPEAFELHPTTDADELALVKFINAIDDTAVDCFADLFNGCRLPALSLPDIQAPRRIMQEGCQIKVIKVCKVPGPGSSCLGWEIERKQVCNG